MRTEKQEMAGRIVFMFRSLPLFLLSSLLIFVSSASAQHAAPSPSESPEPIDASETLRIETDLVDLNVSVFNRDRRRMVGQLEQKDFAIMEDGVFQEISFFAAAESPFDLVLLIDLSGSTRDKLKLIRKSATSFVEAARASDRIAIITFTDRLQIVSPLTLDRKDLKARIKKMQKPQGGTNFWDSLRYVLETMLNPVRSARRSAVVVMTDGVDNALPDVPGPGSQTAFNELLALVGTSSSIVIPIYLDTERETLKDHRQYFPNAFQEARQQLALLASESGSTIYYARKVEDLKDLYQTVIHDLGTVYSVGYRPSNRARDGSWRAVRVQLNGQPDLAIRTRRGYFAK
jgi:Ca-activated chloride channel homolog